MQGRARDRTDLEEHLALMAQSYTEKHRLMMQLANGKKGQENVLKCSDSNRGTAVLYHFRADNEPPIDGVRQFEKYLLDAQNGFVPDKLTRRCGTKCIEENARQRGQR